MDIHKKEYLTRIKELNIIPNFFMSNTYFQQPSLVGKEKENWIWIEEDGVILFPAVPKENCVNKPPIYGFWASFPVSVLHENAQFLDYQYIYDPKTFLNMEGSKWQTFRKNSRKYLKRHTNCEYTDYRDECQVRNLLANWLKQRKENVHDVEFIANCILFPRPMDYTKYLYRGTELIAINYADENYKYINYRFIICKNEPFADEYSRLLFYTDEIIQNKNKLVNDGGVLDSIGLEKFKDKMNPVEKLKIYSY